MKKKLIIVAVATAAMIAGYVLLAPGTVSYVAPDATEEPTVVEQVQEMVSPKSDVEHAQDMLREATAMLDAEEERLVLEIEEASSTYNTIRVEKEAKIAEINEIRASF